MTATTRTTECTAAAATLYLAFELGSTKWTLGFTHGAGAAAAGADDRRGRSARARAGDAQAKARFGLARGAGAELL